MPNPKRRHSHSRTRQRRAHDALKVPQFYIDKDTGEAKKPHRIDPKTGMYKGRQIIEVKETRIVRICDFQICSLRLKFNSIPKSEIRNPKSKMANNAGIIGMGHAYPEGILTNADLEKIVETIG